jgi:NAD(P)-dependent dehydrogenase (short-subunit alcohol dehydrogenase family)
MNDPNAGAVLVTGASSGIGRTTALYLDQQGFRVFAGVRKDADGEALKQASPRLVPVRIDVSDAASIAAARAWIESQTTSLAGLVNNAGISVTGPVEFLPIDEWRHQLDVNLLGQVAVTQAFLPLLRAARGRIVNVGSIGGLFAAPMFGPYSASKFAMEAFNDALRRELRPWAMQVVMVEPGAIATPIWNKGVSTADDVLAGLPPATMELYGPVITNIRREALAMNQRGIPPERVARVVHHALTARWPRTRYLVGMDAKVQAFVARWLPTRLVDAVIGWATGATRR